MKSGWFKFLVIGALHVIWIKCCQKWGKWTMLYSHCVEFLVGKFIPA